MLSGFKEEIFMAFGDVSGKKRKEPDRKRKEKVE